ncbi:copper-transporting ATPase, putative [Trichophyton benhamiae CBS 112371]|uniref:Copper-transporting ATPase, putative n=1 Tax=Arthroderma benhamiae (strain ATCC MYA-4681 / CBS 112371) TaxID=663331 RepID=D4AWA9_ARTBC|nr:copper-transporting ATPase, putative [Trichophyton benhamiae CBS 112371]EFE32649.1 copper-transporting ATPase, putative [Trichophyton benhamiae CBS 112371]
MACGNKSGCCAGEKKPPTAFSSSCSPAEDDRARVMARLPGRDAACCDPEADERCDAVDEHVHEHGDDGKHGAVACSSHLRLAFERFSSYLETAQCICRSVIASHSLTPCCAGQAASSHPAPNHAHKHVHEDKDIDLDDTSSCSGHDHDHDHDHDDDTHSHSHANDNPTGIIKGAAVDLEKSAGHEHVLLAVSGMTCSGCGNKLSRALQESPAVYNVKVNFVLGNAEFDLDTAHTSIEALIDRLDRLTGFRCVKASSSADDQHLDLLVPPGTAPNVTVESLPAGVTQVDILDARTVRIAFDPLAIGARDLLQAMGDRTSGLSPVNNHRDPAASAGRKRLYAMLYKTTYAALLTIPVLVLAWGHSLTGPRTKVIVSLVLATGVQALAVPEFYKPAITSLIYSRVVEMDMLVVISITAAYLYSLVAVGFTLADKPLATPEFFETSTLLITLVLFGRLVAAYARIRAVEAVSTRSLQPATALLLEDAHAAAAGQTREIDARLLQFGDKFLVSPHCTIPTDGRVLEGTSEVDESMLTGESLPVLKKKGAQLIAGTINGSGSLTALLTRLPGKNTVAEISNLVEEASSHKPRVQDLADKVAGWFVPIVTAAASIVLVVWLLVCLLVRHQAAGGAIGTAITYTIAVFAVSCPCAVGLAVPMVLVVAGGIAARAGVIIKSAESTERAHRVTDVVLDKTGTITTADLEVVETVLLPQPEPESHQYTLSLVSALVRDNKHPVSIAVSKHLASQNQNQNQDQDQDQPSQRLENIRIIPGAGVECVTDTSILRAGSARWLHVQSHPDVSRLITGGMSTLCITRNDTLIAVFGLKNNPRPESARVIQKLQSRGLSVHVVSGDETKAVEEIASAVGIPTAHIAARQTPSDKQAYVTRLMEQGKTVLFCGDGTNDAVAITQADVGVQIGSSSDVSRATADVVLLGGLEGVVVLLDVSRASFRRIVFNFVWSALYNVFAILLAAGAFVYVRIPPAYAGLGEIVSVLPVILAALSMFWTRRSLAV